MSQSPQKSTSATASPRSSPTKKEIDAATAALNHFAQGKRHLVVGDIPSAVNSLQEACRHLAEEYGETAPEVGDAYYHYGKALLEMARIENGVLGNALEGEEGSTEDEEEGDDDDDEDGEEEGEGEGDGEKGEAAEGESQDVDSNKAENGSLEGEGEKTEEDEEEVSNLQLAWEVLELAKVIFMKQQDANPDMAKKVAQVYLMLGEVALESENYSQGVEDFTQCLEIQEKNLPADDRCLAESHYQLGVAHSFSDDFDKAASSFGAAIDVITLRISNLEQRMKEKKTWTEEQHKQDAAVRPDPFYTEEGEIEELKQLLPEMKEKIVDMEQMKKDSKEKLQKVTKEALMAQAIGGRSSGGSSSSSSPSPSTSGFGASPSSSSSTSNAFGAPSSSAGTGEVKMITHLVRKKRKAEDEKQDEVKKARGENGEAMKNESMETKENGQVKSEDSTPTKDLESQKAAAAAELKTKSEELKKEEPKAVA